MKRWDTQTNKKTYWARIIIILNLHFSLIYVRQKHDVFASYQKAIKLYGTLIVAL